MVSKTLFGDLLEADAKTLERLVELALKIKAQPADYQAAAQGKMLYALYQKSSTRTHLSFARTMQRLGGAYIWSAWSDSNFAISDIEHEVKYVSTTADLIMARLLSYEDVQQFCSHSEVPFINGCCDTFHPMQGLADAQTMFELVGDWSKVHCVYVGVYNNVTNSLATVLPRLGAKLTAICPEVNEKALRLGPAAKEIESGRFELIQDASAKVLRDAIEHSNVVYTDTWVDMEVMVDKSQSQTVRERIERLREFQLNANTYGKSNAHIMHCMPVHPGYEISKELIQHPRSRILQQADNRCWAQAGVVVQALSSS